MRVPSAALVRTSKGLLRGAVGDGVAVFKGIPFAKPPLGPLRFRPAQPAEPWEGTRDATETGNAPMQVVDESSVQNPVSEDCLYLNVFAPSEPGPHPVFVWAYGGGNATGDAGMDLFDGSEFARRGVVLVTVNYRVSALGWMKVDGLLGPGYADGFNQGLTDMIMALQWVRDEVACFGGDPARVTLGGESAGAKNTMSLLATNDEVRSLFQAVILESGTAQCVWDAGAADVLAAQVLRALGLTRQNAERLLTIDAGELVGAHREAIEAPGIYGFNARPVADGRFLRSSGLEAARAGRIKGLRVLIGNNLDEYEFMMQPAPLTEDPGVERMTYVATPRMARDINERYRLLHPHAADEERRFRLMCDEEWWIPNIRFAEALLGQGNADVWMYRFDFQPSSAPLWRRAAHTVEIPFVFGTLDSRWARLVVGPTPGARELSVKMLDAWTRFIKGDAPGGGGLPAWPTYDVQGRHVMILDSDSRVESDPCSAARRAWDGVQ